MKVRGNTLFGRALAREGVRTAFFLLGGPMNEGISAGDAEGIRMIDVRHEQAAAMMAHAYARVLGRPGVCIACSGPGTTNLVTGVAGALIDCVPLVALGGCSPLDQLMKGGAFQEIDQVAIMRPVTKWAERVYEARRIPDYIELAFRTALSGKPGPVYLDFPGDVLFQEADDEDVEPTTAPTRDVAKPVATPAAIERLIALLREAKRPIVISGSGILWSQAFEELQHFVETTGIPFYTTPQGRGVVPEDHVYFYPHARSAAFKEADLVLVIGTRLNYVISYGQPPRFAESATFVRIDIDPTEINQSRRLSLGIVGDAKMVLRQICAEIEGKFDRGCYEPWRGHLATIQSERQREQEVTLSSDQVPIHALRLCKEIRDFMDRDAILAVDGQEILNFGRQVLPTFIPGHRLNSGPFGTMGVGLPFGVGAKAAKPDKQVIVLHGDGSFGMNGMELDTAVRHKLPILVVISLNGGWTADTEGQKRIPGKARIGRHLGYTRFDKVAAALGCYAEFVERPEEIRPALERAGRAVKNGQTALVNVVTDSRARSQTTKFTNYAT
ncbi:MAG TPA: thiamine pyrophosphate-binding protein [bacterium]|nr:thiamine pyrophosphate-binding protein [bacterium]